MSTEKMREEFEAAVVAEFKSAGCEGGPDLCRDNNNGDYLNQAVGGDWWAWQASRAAIEVDLTDVRKTTALPDRTWLLGNDVVSTIESLGLKVKS